MPDNVYECMFLLDTNKIAGDVPGAAAKLHSIFERNAAEVLASRQWEERRLAYPVQGHKKGLYYLTYIRAEGEKLREIDHDISLTEIVLRHLMLKIDPKLVDVMLTLARDEHAMALRSMHDGDGDGDGEGDHEGDRGDRPRRGRREDRDRDRDRD